MLVVVLVLDRPFEKDAGLDRGNRSGSVGLLGLETFGGFLVGSQDGDLDRGDLDGIGDALLERDPRLGDLEKVDHRPVGHELGQDGLGFLDLLGLGDGSFEVGSVGEDLEGYRGVTEQDLELLLHEAHLIDRLDVEDGLAPGVPDDELGGGGFLTHTRKYDLVIGNVEDLDDAFLYRHDLLEVHDLDGDRLPDGDDEFFLSLGPGLDRDEQGGKDRYGEEKGDGKPFHVLLVHRYHLSSHQPFDPLVEGEGLD